MLPVWLAMRNNRKFLLFHYEDVLQDPEQELEKMAAFLLAANPRLRRAVELSSAGRMRELEKTHSRDWRLRGTPDKINR
jgi:sulfotransferase family protein